MKREYVKTGKGYRRLKRGEVIRQGDEIFIGYWWKCGCIIGDRVNHGKIRRPKKGAK